MAYALVLSKLSPEGAKAVLAEGMVGRRAAMEDFADRLGCKVIAYFAADDGEWDIVNLSEVPDDPAFSARAQMNLTQSGAYSNVRVVRLVTAEDFDNFDSSLVTSFRTPGR
jgi:uncharacterized protein with GYD domain